MLAYQRVFVNMGATFGPTFEKVFKDRGEHVESTEAKKIA